MSKDNTLNHIIDNTEGKKLVEVIKDQISKSKEAKFAIGYFFLNGFSLVKDDFPKDVSTHPFLKIVMGNETTFSTKKELAKGYELREIFKQKMIEDLQYRNFTEEEKKYIRTLKELIKDNIIEVKLFDKSKLHAKLYLFLTDPEGKYTSPGLAIVGSSNFTYAGLTTNKELNVLLTARQDVLYLNEWFEKLWKEAIVFNEDMIKIIDMSGVIDGSPYPKIGKMVEPEFLFKYFVYKWFGDRVFGLTQKDILMEFQVVGVLNIVDKMNFYNGAILADSVGLGKSFIASALIEEILYGKHASWIKKNKKPAIMLILPPSTIPQWEELLVGKFRYFLKDTNARCIKNADNDKIYEIYGEEKYGTLRFMSLGIFQNLKVQDLEEIKEEYDVFVIDEAHKYRNQKTNRWKNADKLRRKQSGVYNKFLLLTATPFNNSIYDVLNLIKIFTDDTYAPFFLKGINVKELIKKYVKLKKDLRERDDKDIRKEIKEKSVEVKKKILDEIMVLRTRKYIQEQFKDIKVNGKPFVFKDPKPYILDYSNFYTDQYRNLLEVINNNLSLINFEHTKLYGTRYIVFEEETIDNEEPKKNLIEIADLFKLLLGKRLESGIFAFESTLKSVYEKEKIFYKIFKNSNIVNEEDIKPLINKALEEAKIEKDLEEIEEVYEVEEEDKNETLFDRVKKILHDYAQNEDKSVEGNYIDILKIGLKIILNNLKEDIKYMENIFNELNNIKEKDKILGKIPKKRNSIVEIPIYSYIDDPKLRTLKQLMINPLLKSKYLKEIPPINNKKILIFTQYKDTAYYLYHNLINWIEKESDLHYWLYDNKKRIKVGLVTGGTDTSTKVNYIKRFAPRSNSGQEVVNELGEIDILISTDALSEGVNLQDADVVINYDLPWNPMVIVQRVGRVNRIGNEKDVLVINYVPSQEIEIIVGILSKLKEKIKDITMIIGKDVKILSPNEAINVETFGEKIKKMSSQTMASLEQYGISDDFDEFIPNEMSAEELDEYKLLNKIQYDLGYTSKDFQEVKKVKDDTYYSFIKGNNKLISFYEFYRGEYKILKKIFVHTSNGIKEASPIVFLDLINNSQSQVYKIENTMETLKSIQKECLREEKRLKQEYQQDPGGFIEKLYNILYINMGKTKDKERLHIVLNTLARLPYRATNYSKKLKELLISQRLMEENRDRISLIENIDKVTLSVYKFFTDKGLVSIESLNIKTKHVGWFYENE